MAYFTASGMRDTWSLADGLEREEHDEQMRHEGKHEWRLRFAYTLNFHALPNDWKGIVHSLCMIANSWAWYIKDTRSDRLER